MNENVELPTQDPQDNEIHKFNYIMHERKTVKEKTMSSLKGFGLIVFGYLICYIGFSITLIALLFILFGSYVALDIHNTKRRDKITTKYNNTSIKPAEFQQLLKDSSPWLSFPDWERADWMNDVIEQLWPSLSNILVKKFRGTLEKKIRKKFSSFQFENIDFGKMPPKIDGIKVYKQDSKKNSVIIDFDIVYDGDCKITCALSNREVATIKDFQLSVDVRVILKPILLNVPLIGGLQLFFLNSPDINFDLEGISNVPGLSYIIRQKIEEIITKHFVFPNSFTKTFTKSVEVENLKSLEPQGVLRVHVFEARNLEKKDVGGKSDPYVILNIGAQSYKTEVISRTLNPQWDFWCEFVVLDYTSQQLHFQVYDKDFNGDDFLGSGTLNIEEVVDGKTDQWIKLNRVKRGEVHLRLTWLTLCSDYVKLNEISDDARWVLKKEELSSGLLTVFINSAQNLPRNKHYKKPHAYFVLKLGKTIKKSKVKKFTTDPIWDQGFSLLVPSPESDVLSISVMDKETDEVLAEFSYSIGQLAQKPDLSIIKQELESCKDKITTTIVISLQMKILMEEFKEDLDQDLSYSLSDVSSTSVSRQISIDEDLMIKAEEIPVNLNPNKIIPEESSEETEPKYITDNSKQLGEIELSIAYNDFAQKFVIIVHQIRNLPIKNPHDIPDPYVKIQLEPFSTKTHKTKVLTDNCNPIYEEEFDFLISKENLFKSKLIITVKTKKYFSSKNVMGQVLLDFEENQTIDLNCRKWYELRSK